MYAVLILATTLFTGADHWIEPAHHRVLEAQQSEAASMEEGKIYGARGEYESFQVVLQGDRKGAEALAFTATAPHDTIPAPDIFRVGYVGVGAASGRAMAEAPYWPDVLLPNRPVSLEPEAFAVYWVRYFIPRDAKPGIHRGELQIRPERGRSTRIPVRVEVFDFELPEESSLICFGDIDRDRLARLYNTGDALAEWSPLYDLVADYGLSFSGLPGFSRQAIEHGQYLLERMPAIEIAPPPMRRGTLNAEGRRSLIHHPLANYVEGIAESLDSEENGVYFETCLESDRASWRNALAAARALPEDRDNFERLIRGPFHPAMLDAADAVALTLDAYSPTLMERLKLGAGVVSAPAVQAAVSVSGARPPSEGPEIYDGSLWTSWYPAAEDGNSWALLDLAAPMRLEEIRIIWDTPEACTAIELETSIDGVRYSKASTTWQHASAVGPYGQSYSTGRLQYPAAIVSFRIHLSCGEMGAPGIREVLLNQEVREHAPTEAKPLEVWLAPTHESFPSPALDAHGVELRLIPWVARHMNFDGVSGLSLSDWPTAWEALPAQAPLVWEIDASDAGRAFLFYPIEGRVLGSTRLEILRDGLEDLAYWDLLEEAVEEEQLGADATAYSHANRRINFGVHTRRSELEAMIAYIERARVETGRALSKIEE